MDNLEQENAAVEGFTAEETAAFETMRSGAQPEPAPQEQQPAQPAEPVRAEQPEEKKGDLGVALRQEREARKAVEARLRDMELQQARLDERLRAPQPQQRQPDPPPDPYQDPTGYMLAREQAFVQGLDGIQRKLQTYEQQKQQEQIKAAVYQDYVADGARFKAATPDFDDVYGHYIATRHEELKAWGVTNDQQRGQMILDEELKMAFAARQRGFSPAEVVYNMARARGYAPKPAPQAADPAAKIEKVAAAQQQNRSMANAEGKGAAEVTAQVLASMSDDEFETWKNKNPAKFRQIMGAAR